MQTRIRGCVILSCKFIKESLKKIGHLGVMEIIKSNAKNIDCIINKIKIPLRCYLTR